MKRGLAVLALLMAMAMPSFAADSTVVVVVRHAEKALDDPRDPHLDDAGKQRAQRLAALLADSRLDAAFATQYRRTRETAAPAAAQAGIDVLVRPVSADNAATYADDLARDIRALPPGSTVLVVGHSNTVPELVKAISGASAEPMPETEYDRFTVVVLDADGQHRSLVSRY